MKGRFKVGFLLMLALAMVVSSLAGCAPAVEEEEVVVTEEEEVVLPRTEVEELPPTRLCGVCGKTVDVYEATEAGLTTKCTTYVPSYGSTLVFFFCSEDCKAKFAEETAKYVEKCAICGIIVYKKEAEAQGLTTVYEGKTYYFNSPLCKKAFDADPAAAVAKLTECPVCGITVIKEHSELAGLTSERDGVTYYFGSTVCKEKFETGLAMCPVTGEMVDKEKAEELGLSVTIKMWTFYFSSADAKEKFAPMPAVYLAKCAICGGLVAKNKAEKEGWLSVYEGATFYFCGAEHKAEFDKAPAEVTAKLSVCPPCGMWVIKEACEAMGLTTVYEGRTYYFCKAGCKGMFEADPEKFLAKCPVSREKVIMKEAEKRGWTSEYEGITYYFSSSDAKAAFDKEPENYVKAELPAGLAVCPVTGIAVDTEKAEELGLSVTIKMWTFYFSSAEAKSEFAPMPAVYIAKCAMCGGLVGKKEADRMEWLSVYEGAKFYFCGDEHKAEFDAAPEEEVAKLSVCPICGMWVIKEKQEAMGLTTVYEGKTYYFCKEGCKGMFEADPEKFLATCPVSGEKVIMKEAENWGRTSEYEGVTYYFSSSDAKAAFDEEPEKYVK